MTDYLQGTGEGGTMIIRDLGYQVQFLIQAGYDESFAYGVPWNIWVNGADQVGTFDYDSGRPWVLVAQYDVGYTQDVKFAIGVSGTDGLGGPTEFWHNIFRPTVPDPPTAVSLTALSPTVLRFIFSGNGDGGLPIDQWVVHLSTDPGFGTLVYNMPSDGLTDFGALIPHTTYYARAFGHNALGYSAASNVLSATTLAAARVKIDETYQYVQPFIKDGGVYKAALPLVKSDGTYHNVG